MDKRIDTLYRAGKVSKAIHLLIEKIDQNPKEVDAYLQLATYLIAQNSVLQATQLLRQAQEVVLEPQKLTYDLALCYYLQGKFKAALELLKLIPNDDSALYQKALIYLKMGAPEKALAFVLTIKKCDDHVKELLADCWLSLGDLKQAQQSLKQISSEQRSAKIWFLLGVTTLSQDRHQATAFFNRSRQKSPAIYKQLNQRYAALMKLVHDRQKKSGSDD